MKPNTQLREKKSGVKLKSTRRVRSEPTTSSCKCVRYDKSKKAWFMKLPNGEEAGYDTYPSHNCQPTEKPMEQIDLGQGKYKPWYSLPMIEAHIVAEYKQKLIKRWEIKYEEWLNKPDKGDSKIWVDGGLTALLEVRREVLKLITRVR